MGTLRQRFGANLRRLRQARRLTQERLADRAGLDPKYLGSVERGQENISLDRIERLARALGVDAVELLEPEERGRDAGLVRAVSRAEALLRRTKSGRRRLMLRLLEDVANEGKYGTGDA
jgi:transcriptional regulator with XRE-family HTH domain